MRSILLWALVFSTCASGCAAYHVDVVADEKAATAAPAAPVFIEPFSAATLARYRPRYYAYYGPVPRKALLATPPLLAALHEGALAALRATPAFVGTRALVGPPPPEDVVVARLTVLDEHVIWTNRGAKGLACGLGFFFPPLWIYDAFPVEVDERFAGEVLLFRVPGAQVKTRMASVPGLPDPIFNMAGLAPFARRPFKAVLHSERGYLRDDPPPVREQALIDPVAHYLAAVLQRAASAPAPVPSAAQPAAAPTEAIPSP